MKKTSERFDRAYNALVNAFFTGTLAKATCVACAVGNIVASGMGGTIKKFNSIYTHPYDCTVANTQWNELFLSGPRGWNRISEKLNLSKKIEDITGYSADIMCEIERVFEENTHIDYTDYRNHDEQEILEDQYNGLCAVVDILLKFEGIENEGHKEKFRTHPKL